MLMALLMAVSAFGQFNNIFRKDLGTLTFATDDKIAVYDASGSISGGLRTGSVTWTNFLAGLAVSQKALYTQDFVLTVDTNSVVANASASTQSISLLTGELLNVIGLYPGGVWSTEDFIEFNNADSNATTLDTMNITTNNKWISEGAFEFYATQDCTIYINLGDTVTVASTVKCKVKYTIK